MKFLHGRTKRYGGPCMYNTQTLLTKIDAWHIYLYMKNIKIFVSKMLDFLFPFPFYEKKCDPTTTHGCGLK